MQTFFVNLLDSQIRNQPGHLLLKILLLYIQNGLLASLITQSILMMYNAMVLKILLQTAHIHGHIIVDILKM